MSQHLPFSGTIYSMNQPIPSRLKRSVADIKSCTAAKIMLFVEKEQSGEPKSNVWRVNEARGAILVWRVILGSLYLGQEKK